MRVLLTGGAGFIGSHTADLLIEQGHEVTIVDSLVEQVHHSTKPSYLNPKAEFFRDDIADVDTWKKHLKEKDVILHLASMAGLAQSMYEPYKYTLANVQGTASMYEALIKDTTVRKHIKKIILASSKTVYGEGAYECSTHGRVYPGLRPAGQLEKQDWEVRCPECAEQMRPTPIPEAKPPQCLSLYALTKYSSEQMAALYEETLKIPTVEFRYFSVFGPRQSLSNPYTGVCSIFLSRIKNGNPPVIFEDGNQMRDFIFVEDVARANALAVEKEEASGILNIGSGEGQTINNVACTIGEVLGKDVTPQCEGKFRYGDTRHDLSDNAAARRVLGFKPRHTFKEGIKRLVEWGEGEEAWDTFEQAEEERKRLLGR